jgi:sulfur carrier protein
VAFLVTTFLKQIYKGMEIILNNQHHFINEGATLQDIVFSQLNEKQNGVAVAVNDNVIPKQNWSTTPLHSNDTILIIKVTQGG